jgi:hypothetical protein
VRAGAMLMRCPMIGMLLERLQPGALTRSDDAPYRDPTRMRGAR